MQKLKVGIIGATGMVGQRFIMLLNTCCIMILWLGIQNPWSRLMDNMLFSWICLYESNCSL